jgi:hypothetical protein
MTNLLKKAVEAVERLPPANQERIARIMLTLAGEHDAPEEIDPEHLAGVLEGLAQAERGEYASDAEVAAAFRLFGA